MTIKPVFVALAAATLIFGLARCSTLPDPKVKKFIFPKEAYVDVPKRSFRKLGLVRTKVNYTSLNPNWEESNLCKNYFNKAVIDLVTRAKERGADAVVEVRSIVFLVDGRTESYPKPECSDDGSEGQVLAQGIAVKWDVDPELDRKRREKLWQEGRLKVEPHPLLQKIRPKPSTTPIEEVPAEVSTSSEPSPEVRPSIQNETPVAVPRPQDGIFEEAD